MASIVTINNLPSAVTPLSATNLISISQDGLQLTKATIGDVYAFVKSLRPLPTLTNATTTTETIIARWQIPANFLLANDSFVLKTSGQAGGTGTLTFRVRIGTTGTITDSVVVTNATTVAQTANAQVSTDHLVQFTTVGTGGSARGNGFVVAQSALYGTNTAANTPVSINTATTFFVSVTMTQSVAATYSSLAASLL